MNTERDLAGLKKQIIDTLLYVMENGETSMARLEAAQRLTYEVQQAEARRFYEAQANERSIAAPQTLGGFVGAGLL
jgi:hypothetical protein